MFIVQRMSSNDEWIDEPCMPFSCVECAEYYIDMRRKHCEGNPCYRIVKRTDIIIGMKGK